MRVSQPQTELFIRLYTDSVKTILILHNKKTTFPAKCGMSFFVWIGALNFQASGCMTSW